MAQKRATFLHAAYKTRLAARKKQWPPGGSCTGRTARNVTASTRGGKTEDLTCTLLPSRIPRRKLFF